jgi:predicted ATPase
MRCTLDELSMPRLVRITLLRERVEDWKVYPFNVPVIRGFEWLDFKHQVTFFTGENGSGKSTFMEAIAFHSGFGLEGGTRNFRIQTTESVESVLPLSRALRLSWRKQNQKGYYLRAESFFNNASYLDDIGVNMTSYGGKSLHEQSHGESFLALVSNKLQRGGFYLFDEPEAALSPARQLSLLRILHDALKADPDIQFVISTHSPIILAFPNATILSFDEGSIHEIAYEESVPFAIVSGFVRNRQRSLKELFDE